MVNIEYKLFGLEQRKGAESFRNDFASRDIQAPVLAVSPMVLHIGQGGVKSQSCAQKSTPSVLHRSAVP